MRYRLQLLGPPRLTGPEGLLRLPSQKAQALLWYIAAQPDRSFGRAHLVNLFWGDHSEEDGRQNLSSLLSRLRKALPFRPICIADDQIGWDPDAGVELDSESFLHLTRTCAGGSPDDRDETGAADCAKAVGLWRGAFLEGFYLPANAEYESWLQVERQQWEQRALKLLGGLVQRAERQGNAEAVVVLAEKALLIDPLNEHYHRALMAAYHQCGNRAKALSQFNQCRDRLMKELGVAPDPATVRLRDDLFESPALPGPDQSPLRPRPPVPPAAPDTSRPDWATAPSLAGRPTELRWLKEQVSQTFRDESRVICLRGEPGSGKSRLVADLAPQTPAVICRCREAIRTMPLQPVLDGLGDLVDSPEIRAARLPQLLTTLKNLPATLLVVEDIEWADGQTLMLLDHLAHHSFPHRLLITARTGPLPEPVEVLVRGLARSQHLVEWTLEPLSPDAVYELAAQLLPALPPHKLSELAEYTGGNPLFIREVLHSLAAPGSRHPTSTGWMDDLPLSATVRATVADFLAFLPLEAHDLAVAVSLFPSSAPFGALCQMTGLAEETALSALNGLLETGLIVEPGPGQIGFAHGLAQRAIQDEQSQTRLLLFRQRVERPPIRLSDKSGD